MLRGLPDQMLAGAEADLQPHSVRRHAAAERCREVDPCGRLRHGKREARQQRVEQRLLPDAQLLAPTTTVQRASTVFLHELLTSPRRSGTGPWSTSRR